MKFYIRKIGSQTICGPYTKEEIADQLPTELERMNIEAFPDRGQSAEMIGKLSGWVPVKALFQREPNAQVMEATFYAKERHWITALSRIALWMIGAAAAFQIYLGLKLEQPIAFLSALGIITFGFLVVLGIKYGILMLADIADVQRGRGEWEG